MPTSRSKRALAKRDVQLLADLRQRPADAWHRPMDLGAHDGSYHSHSLAKLERRGLVESQQRGTSAANSRGSKVYRAIPETPHVDA